MDELIAQFETVVVTDYSTKLWTVYTILEHDNITLSKKLRVDQYYNELVGNIKNNVNPRQSFEKLVAIMGSFDDTYGTTKEYSALAHARLNYDYMVKYLQEIYEDAKYIDHVATQFAEMVFNWRLTLAEI